MAKEITWKEDSKRFICFLDIMGFKNLIETHSHDEVKSMLIELSKSKDYIISKNKELLDGVSIPEYKDCLLDIVSFSDSIVIFTNDDKVFDFLLISYAARRILNDAFNLSIPIKGAISYGHLTADFKNSIFLGRPLVNAYLMQENLHYYGVVLDHSAEEYYKNNSTICDPHKVYQLKKTPFKGGKVLHANLTLGKTAKVESLKKLYNSVSGLTRAYVDNTIEMYSE